MTTALPDWMVLPPEGITVAEYEALPEEICKRIEIVDGAIIVSPAPLRSHQRIARRLANVLDGASGSLVAVDIDVDLRLRDIPLLNRRPDVVVYDASLPTDAVLRPEHCLLVVEVMSPGSVTADRLDKPAEYAAAGIGHYWRVETDETGTLTLFRYRPDSGARAYAMAGVEQGRVEVEEPFGVCVDLADLVR
ncbi:MAG: Uma2 family endonuclease [Streptosporangiales bacterium]|nr:Uma2 family endonuclease [Streptosporangiales bacterium]MBO0890759.1 Uma2 family endonuclease [Acidothermales bacterium]